MCTASSKVNLLTHLNLVLPRRFNDANPVRFRTYFSADRGCLRFRDLLAHYDRPWSTSTANAIKTDLTWSLRHREP